MSVIRLRYYETLTFFWHDLKGECTNHCYLFSKMLGLDAQEQSWAISLAKGRVDWTVCDQDTLDGASMALLIYPELTWEEECKMALLHRHSVVPPSMCKQAVKNAETYLKKQERWKCQ